MKIILFYLFLSFISEICLSQNSGCLDRISLKMNKPLKVNCLVISQYIYDLSLEVDEYDGCRFDGYILIKNTSNRPVYFKAIHPIRNKIDFSSIYNYQLLKANDSGYFYVRGFEPHICNILRGNTTYFDPNYREIIRMMPDSTIFGLNFWISEIIISRKRKILNMDVRGYEVASVNSKYIYNIVATFYHKKCNLIDDSYLIDNKKQDTLMKHLIKKTCESP